MVNLVDDLEQRGYVVRVRDLRDRRRYAVTLTECGERQLRGGLDAVEDEVTAGSSKTSASRTANA